MSVDRSVRPLRTLLVDNYDSFTYNLFQLIAEVNGAEPVVLRNDEPEPPTLAGFDNIVISPGPGRPDVPRDFGISRHLIERAELPLLGVCLGHQGIVQAAGGTVTAAPAARHGYPDRIAHDGRDLFAGVPGEFTAVRYHSLCAARPLPDVLDITATAPDGVIMGVRHRERPQWGVQFHPESIASAHGAALLRNFARLTIEHAVRPGQAAPGRTPAPGPHDHRARANVRAPSVPRPRTGEPRSIAPAAPHTVPEPAVHHQVPEPTAHEAGEPTEQHTTPEPAGLHQTPEPIRLHRTPDPAELREAPEPAEPHEAPEPTARHEVPEPAVLHKTPELTALHEVVDRAVDTETAFLRLYRDAGTAFWLDGAHVERGPDRFSFLGDASGPLAEVVRYRVGDGSVEVESRTGRRGVPGTVLDHLSRQLRRRRIRIPDVPFDFVGGYVGYLGYEVKADCGAAAAHRAPAPDAQWIFADRVIVVDHLAQRTHLIAVTDADHRAAGRRWLAETRAAVDDLPGPVPPDELDLPADEERVAAGLTRGRDRYLADIATIRARLHAGETYEVNLTDTVHVDADCDGLAVYRALRRSNPAPCAAYLRFGELEIACSSPERFLKVDRAGRVESRPIKGTAPRGRTPVADENLRRALESDPKTRAENLMIVDLLRNDLGRVCEVGSVHVPELMVAESYTTMHQLVSTVRGRLRPDADVIDCLRACFPGGSMTGAPKLRTMEIIDELETEARGIYSGTLGFLGLGGTADLNIVIRTAVRHDGHWRIGAGGAIVLDSTPQDEYREMVLKAAAALRAIIAADRTNPAAAPA
ncbi:aminodeoxychorismate synthase component I [Nocardia sp. BMG51109]|uniref:aminodeoxychorismate synthase component I n=1 Tax=Nocardia sp. BMG51109 TaxID=1056816 RepID=UPI0004630EA6|nr:aminodeoxychorismate synthase component I [Nocardia sp. BMG51109]